SKAFSSSSTGEAAPRGSTAGAASARPISRPTSARHVRLPMRSPDLAHDAIDPVPEVAALVPGGRLGLGLPARVGGAGAELVPAGRGVPGEPPEAPGAGVIRPSER